MEVGFTPRCASSAIRCTIVCLESVAPLKALNESRYHSKVFGETAFKYCRSLMNCSIMEPPAGRGSNSVLPLVSA
jgi:hypothetical protein